MAYECPLPPPFNNPWDTVDCYNHEFRQPYDETVDAVAFTSMVLSRSPSASTMQRYLLQEQDRPLCNIQEDIAQPLPGIVHRATFINTDHCDAWRRHASPLSSGSGLDSGRASDRNTPLWSPEIAGLDHPMDYDHGADILYTLGGAATLQRHDSHIDVSCVSLNEIQTLADEQPDSIAFEGHSPVYSSYTYTQYPQEVYPPQEVYQPQEGYQPQETFQPEEGYQPMDPRDDSSYYSAPSSECAPPATTRKVSVEPVIRRRRAPSAATTSRRVNKRPSNSRRSTSSSYQENQVKLEHACAEAKPGSRAFPCPLAIYGCPSTFGSKNEWKRHVLTQHMCLGFWRCDQCAHANLDRKPNDFNRKDLFIQHVRRMHPLEKPAPTTSPTSKRKSISKTKPDAQDEQYLQAEATRCYRHLRDAPSRSNCLFCDHSFRGGSNTWDERMEHVGRHMESTKKEQKALTDPDQWRRDVDTEDWLLQERIIHHTEHGLCLNEGRNSREGTMARQSD